MKRIALSLSLVAVVAIGVVAFLSWRRYDADQDGQDGEPEPAAAIGVDQDGQEAAPEPAPAILDPVLAVGVEVVSTADAEEEQIILSLAEAKPEVAEEPAAITIDYPLNESIFPPEIIAPTFLWHDESELTDRWLVEVALNGGSSHIYILGEGEPPPRGEDDPRCFGDTNERYEPTDYQASARSWTPSEDVWSAINAHSVAQAATVTVFGFDSSNPDRALSRGRMTLTTSADRVGAPIFYRDVPLMPSPGGEGGVIKPLAGDALPLIAWRLKDISRNDSRSVLTDMPTCANCHSFSADGGTLAMDVDGPSGDKGAYVITPIAETTVIGTDNIITWNSFKDKPEGHKTIGFLSQISPDGQTAVTTVNESLYVTNFTDYRFLQVFYPTRGILAYYSRETEEMLALGGADDADFVHCDPVWTPDGEWIVFARAKAKEPLVEGQLVATRANDPAETPMQYDLYRIRFNGGKGGTPELIEGASQNGMSNTFPKVSPDGKWIVFVKCRNGQLMRPDGRLWIVPAGGGEAREMTCNTDRMNSWHSFSPNGRWMVFSSKTNTPYTQMFLTHIDEDGNDSPPILIANATAANRAVNIPEFVNVGYDEMLAIDTPAVDHYRHLGRGNDLMAAHQYEEAIAEYRKALDVEPSAVTVQSNIGMCLIELGRLDEAAQCFEKVLETEPRNAEVINNMGMVRLRQRRPEEAISYFNKALEINPMLAKAYNNRGLVFTNAGRFDRAISDYDRALEINPSFAEVYNNRGVVYDKKDLCDRAILDYDKALEINPRYAEAYNNRGLAYVGKNLYGRAISDYSKALEINPRHAMAYNNRAVAYYFERQYDKAREDVSEAQRLGYPVHPGFLQALRQASGR